MGRVRLSGGRVSGSSITVPDDAFVAKFKGTCKLCGKPYVPGDLIRSAGKGKGASHKLCREWHFRARNNPQTKDGGYGVEPGTPTREQRRLVTSSNRKIDKNSAFNRK